jgi:colanic acid/amylovoran biosynthesis glycosyltransferase
MNPPPAGQPGRGASSPGTLRIAVLVTTFPSVSETFVLREIAGLLERGHQVDIFPLQLGRDDVVHPQVREYRLLERTHPPPSPDLPFSARLGRAVGLAARHLWRTPLPLLRAMDPRRHGWRGPALRVLMEVSPLVGRGAYDVVYCHFGPNGLRAVALERLGALRGPIVTVFHGYDITAYPRSQRLDVYRTLFERGALFLPISQNWRHRLLQLGCPPDRIAVHRMGVDLDRLTPRAPRPGHGGPLRVASVARLVEKKGIEFGIRAVAQLAAAGVPVEYRVIGDGPLAPSLAALAAQLGVGDTISLLGAGSEPEVHAALEWCDVFLCPSVTASDGDQEGIPVVLMEAMARAVPVVATEHSGIPELVRHGETGLLAPERDPAALAAALRALAADPDRAAALGRAGRDRVAALHDARRLADELDGLLRAVAGRSSVARSLPGARPAA